VSHGHHRAAAISNGNDEQAALLVPVMHARQARSVHNCIAFVSAYGEGGKGKDGDEEEEVEAQV